MEAAASHFLRSPAPITRRFLFLSDAPGMFTFQADNNPR